MKEKIKKSGKKIRKKNPEKSRKNWRKSKIEENRKSKMKKKILIKLWDFFMNFETLFWYCILLTYLYLLSGELCILNTKYNFRECCILLYFCNVYLSDYYSRKWLMNFALYLELYFISQVWFDFRHCGSG